MKPTVKYLIPVESTGGVLGLEAHKNRNCWVYAPVRCSDKSFLGRYGWSRRAAGVNAIVEFWNSLGEEEQAIFRVGAPADVDRVATVIVPQIRVLFRTTDYVFEFKTFKPKGE